MKLKRIIAAAAIALGALAMNAHAEEDGRTARWWKFHNASICICACVESCKTERITGNSDNREEFHACSTECVDFCVWGDSPRS